jgi:hypothetical protein
MNVRRVFIAVLSYTGTIWLPTHQSLQRDTIDLMQNGFDVREEGLMGCSYIHSARGQMVSLFLQSDAEDLVFVDWDMVWNVGAMRRLLGHDEDVVAGDYPGRKEPLRYHARFLKRADGTMHDEIRSDGLLEVSGAATGFMRIRRSVLERMVTDYPDLIFEDNDQAIKRCYLFFGHLKDGRHLLSDDYSFCDLWRETGGKVYIDTEILLGHIGFKTFVGEYKRWLLPALALRD